MLSLIRLRRSALARPLAFVVAVSTVAPLLPARTARADDSGMVNGTNIAPMGGGFAGGSAGLSSSDSTTLVSGAAGEARTSYPFQLPTARGGAQPSLSLQYSSSSAVGFAGVGWTLDTPSIVRKGVAGVPKFTDDVPTQATSDDFTIDGALLLPVETNPTLPGSLAGYTIPAPGHAWVLYRREIDDGARYFYDGLTWVEQTKNGLRQFGTPLDGGTPSLEQTSDPITGTALSGAVQPTSGGGAEATSTTNASTYTYRWNLVRDTDTSGNTVYYIWDTESQLLGVNPATAGRQFLTDIYDTPNTPNPTPPGAAAPPACSTSVSTRACGMCGTQAGTCSNGVWTWGACEGQGTCNTNTFQSCGTNGIQVCSPQCQWQECLDQTCTGQASQPCGLCGVSNGSCNDGTWSWSTCQQPAGACTPGTSQPCGTGGAGTRQCTSTCTWGTCGCTGPSTQSCWCGQGTETGTCNNGVWSWGACQAPPTACAPGTTRVCNGATGATTQMCDTNTCTWPTCEGAQGTLLDGVLGLVEGTAHAQTSPPSAFAHHVHLTWALPTFPGYPTLVTTQAGLVGPYALSPIWKAPPFAQLTTVDVFSATTASQTRELVREYQLNYTTNNAQTRNYLRSVQLVGDCNSVGGIPESGISATLVASCKAKEAFPATTFTYYGIPSTPPTTTAPAPTILSQSPAYTATGAADFLADLNGDAVDDLVSGTNGMDSVDQCLQQWESANACSINTANELLWQFTLGLFGSGTCPCPSGANVVGPDQGATSTFSTSTSNGLLTYAANDSMWAFSIFADWAATGRTSFLETLPQLPLQAPLVSGGVYTNSNPIQVFLGQLSPPNPQATFQSLQSQILASDATNIVQQIAGTSSQVPSSTLENFAPYNAIDVDGDGLPDMTNMAFANAGGIATYFSTRDRAGVTHPFNVPNVAPATMWEAPSWAWRIPTTNDGDVISGGTFTALTTTGGSNIFDPSTSWMDSTSATFAAADIDGDGLADEVIANKFRGDWNTTMIQGYRGDYNNYPRNVGWTDGSFDYVGLVVLPSRGDGRFGVPPEDTASVIQSGATYSESWNWGYYVTPGAVVPFAPYSWALNNGRPPMDGIGPVPAPQSDSISPTGATQGYSMQSSAIRFGDLNGDGMSDYAVLDGNGLHICLRYGGPWDYAHWSCVTDSALVGNDQSDETQAHATIMIGDVNGSGINRVIYFPAPASTTPFGAPQGAATSVLVSPDGTKGTPRDGLLETVSNGFGASTTFDYATVASLQIGSIPTPEWVVTSVTTSNGLTGTQAVTEKVFYAYATPIYDARDRAFVGFQNVTTTTLSVNDTNGTHGSPGLVTKTTYATQTDNTCASAGCAGVPEAMIHASRFLPALVETSENSTGGTRFTTTAYSYAYQQVYTALDGPVVDGTLGQTAPRPGMTLSQQTVVTYPWNAGQPSTSQTLAAPITFGTYTLPALTVSVPLGTGNIVHQSSYDTNLNEVLTQDFGMSETDTPIIRKSSWSLPQGDTSGWDYRLIESTVGYSDPTGTTLDKSKAVRDLYFGYDSMGRLKEEWTPSVANAVQLPGPPGQPRAAGQPQRAVVSPSAATLHWYQYDQFGNLTYSGDAYNGCETQTTYDLLFAQLPASVVAYPYGCGTPGLTTAVTFDRITEQLTSTLDPAGRLTITDYDDFGRVTEIDQPNMLTAGATTKVLTASYTDVAPVRMIEVQTGYGADTGATGASGFLSHYRYVDGLGETRAVVDGVDPSIHNGSSWVLSGVHNSYVNGRTASVYQPMFVSGPAVAGSLPAQVTAPTSVSSSFYYDGLGRTTYSLDFRGNPSQAVYQDAALAVSLYDAEQLTGAHQGALTTVTRDGHGREISKDAHWVHGPNGQSGDLVTTAVYQATGEPTSVTQTFPGGSSTRQMTYDSLGRMVTNTEPNAGTWTYAYDDAGRLVGTSDARGCGENLVYDGIGRLLAADYSPCNDSQPAYSPLSFDGDFPYPGAEESYAYDNSATGFLLGTADRGRLDGYNYDSAGHVNWVTRQMALPGTNPPGYGKIYNFTVDQFTVAGQPIARSLDGMALAKGGTITQTTTYANDGMVSNVSAAPAGGALISSLSYDPAGRLVAAAYGSGSQNTSGTLTTTITPVNATYGYDANGALTTYGLSELTTLSGPTIRHPTVSQQSFTQTALTLDMVGNPLTLTDAATTAWPAGARAVNQTYIYYDDYRLQSAWSIPPSGSPDTWTNPYAYEQGTGSELYPQPTTEADRFTQVAFAYDWRGNLTSSIDRPANIDFFDRSLGTVLQLPGTDQLASASASTGSLTAYYDAAGNLTSIDEGGTVYSYDWDEVGNLAGATRGAAPETVYETYTYSAGGDRTTTARTIGAGTTTYTVSVFDSLLLKNATYEQDYEDDLSTEQVYLAGGLARLFNDTTGKMPSGEASVTGGVAGNHTFLNLRDPRGSSAFVVDQGTSDIVERTGYLPYGALDCDDRSSLWLSSREDEKFGGGWDNAEVGLVYFRHRYYSPELGRFISPDPVTIHGLRGDPNPYEYAGGNPIRNVDPLGLQCLTLSSGGISGGACDGSSGSEQQTPPPPPPPPPSGNGAEGSSTSAGSQSPSAGGGRGAWPVYGPPTEDEEQASISQTQPTTVAFTPHGFGADWPQQSIYTLQLQYPQGSGQSFAQLLGMTVHVDHTDDAIGYAAMSFTVLQSLLAPEAAPVIAAAGGGDMALGLATRPPGGGPTLLNQFAEGIGAKTYGQLTGSWWPGSYEALETDLTREMNGAASLHFNLEGMDMGRFAEFAKNPVLGDGNITNWELFTILKNPSLLGKTTFYGGVPPAL